MHQSWGKTAAGKKAEVTTTTTTISTKPIQTDDSSPSDSTNTVITTTEDTSDPAWVPPSFDQAVGKAGSENIQEEVKGSENQADNNPSEEKEKDVIVSDPPEVVNRGIDLYNEGNYEAAIELLDGYVSNGPDLHPILTLFRTLNYLRRTQYIMVLDDTYTLQYDFDYAREPLRSYRGEIAYMRGLALFRLHYYADANKQLSRAHSFKENVLLGTYII